MELLGYLAYAVLVLLAVVWTVGVRMKTDAGVPVIFGALFFVVGAIALPLSSTSNLHALWIIPTGFLLSAIIIPLLAVHIAPLFAPIRLLASMFAAVIRVGK